MRLAFHAGSELAEAQVLADGWHLEADVAHFRDHLREILALCGHLADASVRLVSVVGRGGMGFHGRR